MQTIEMPSRKAGLRGSKRWAWPSYVLPAGAILSLCYLLFAAVRTSHWPLVQDAPLMHYVVFLMSKGFAPYRDIADMNMPGSYMIESAGMRVFGLGAPGWILFNYATILAMIFAAAWVAGPGRQAAGVIAGSYTSLYQLSDGPWDLGQRDWLVAVLLVLSFGFLFQSLRSGRAAWMAGVFLSCGLAASIKPPALLFGMLSLGVVCIKRRSSPRQIGPVLLWSAAGLAVPIAASLLFLLRWHAGASFLEVMHGLVPYYASLHRLSAVILTSKFVKHQVILLFAGAVLLWMNWRDQRGLSIKSLLLLGGVCCAFVMYLSQGKGFGYHIYPGVAFVTLLAMIEVGQALPVPGIRAWFATATVLLVAGILPIFLLQAQAWTVYPTDTLTHLESDMKQLGGTELSGQVQCLDMTMASCINVLYRLKIVQSTGFIYDFYLFPAHATATTTTLQNRFFQQITARPPKLIILSEHTWPDDVYNYDQLARWPEFQSFLEQKYAVIEEFPRAASGSSGYRIYKLVQGNR